MPACPACGHENPEGQRFCGACGTPLAAAPAAREVRKTVTVLFCDVSGSTELAERLDPEALRRVLARYFEAARTVVERHGGTVEKFIGDAVMAVFGVPVVHEDDALRATRAAAELREAVSALNGELVRHHGVALELRIGVNTGEVVTGTAERLATGDAVNVAARLEAAAAPGAILLGENTHALVRDAVRAEPVGPFAVKGKTEAVTAFRLVDVLAHVPAFTRALDAPFVGRAAELGALATAFARAVERRSCELCTVLGPPGIGKSRLARELIARVGAEGRVVVGRCVAYGEGITYLPLAEVVRQVGGDDAREGLAALVGGDEGELVADRIAGALGVADSAGRPEEIAWAFRRLFEALAADRPLVVVLDDVHWAEPSLLDFVEYVASFSAGAPILLLCLARADLVEERPDWAAPRPNATLVTLEPLPERDADDLARRLAAGAGLDDERVERVVAAAEGNPLFVEQLLAFQAEDGDRAIPALLAARVDRLGPEERAVVEAASVEGRLFHAGAVAELVPEVARAGLGSRLLSLVRKQLIRPDRSEFSGEDAFRFGHVLIRDAAYGAASKGLRADLHERYADWLEAKAGDRIAEHEELIGYHLEQACRYRRELGPDDGAGDATARRAAERLGAAGLRAYERRDARAAVNLLTRAADLLAPTDPTRLDLLQPVGELLTDMGEFARAVEILEEARVQAEAFGDRRRAAHALIFAAFAGALGRIDATDDLLAALERAMPVFEHAGDERGLARVHDFRAWVHEASGRPAEMEAAARLALEHARRAGDRRHEAELLWYLFWALEDGPTPVADAIAGCYELIEQAGDDRVAAAQGLATIGRLEALRGRFADAHAALARAGATMDDLGLDVFSYQFDVHRGHIDLLAGAYEDAERRLRTALDRALEMGFGGVGCSAWLAEALAAQGRLHEAGDVARRAAERADARDMTAPVRIGTLQAKILARSGSLDEARALADAAVRQAERSERLVLRGEALLGRAEVARLAGGVADAHTDARAALAVFEAKGATVFAEQARALIASENDRGRR